MNYNDYIKLVQFMKRDNSSNLNAIQNLIKQARCSKCVFEGECRDFDLNGSCQRYKRDPPDGGYYG